MAHRSGRNLRNDHPTTAHPGPNLMTDMLMITFGR